MSRKLVGQWTEQRLLSAKNIDDFGSIYKCWNGLIEVRLSPLTERTNSWIALTAVDLFEQVAKKIDSANQFGVANPKVLAGLKRFQ